MGENNKRISLSVHMISPFILATLTFFINYAAHVSPSRIAIPKGYKSASIVEASPVNEWVRHWQYEALSYALWAFVVSIIISFIIFLWRYNTSKKEITEFQK